MTGGSRGDAEGAETALEDGRTVATAASVASRNAMTMDPPTKFVKSYRFVIDVLVITILGIPILLLFLIGKPFERGFNCADQTLRYPYKDSTVPSIYLYIVGMLLNGIAIVTLEISKYRRNGPSGVLVCGKRIPTVVYNIYTVVIIFGFGMAFCQFTTDMTKYWIGRLRPHFFDVCKPAFSSSNLTQVCNAVTQNPYDYVNQYYCTTSPNKSYEKKLKEMRLSFPSGHSSYGMYTMLFFAIYVQLRWRARHNEQLIKNFLQFLAVFFAIFVGMTRISDYKHHWSDVLGGLTLGTVSALVTMGYVWRFYFTKRRNGDLSLELGVTNGVQMTRVNGHYQ